MGEVDPAARPRRAAGSRIGRFEVVGVLGAGGMGVVYEARDPDLDRPVAIKLIHEPDTQYSLRLLREANALAKLQHPNVIAVHEVGRHEGEVFVAMERVDGVSLDKLEPRPSGWRAVLSLFVQAGRGLAAAHDKGLVHRDVKPHNLLVGRDGRVRVADFGRVRLTPPAPVETEPGRGLADATAATLDDSDASASTVAAPVEAGALGWDLTHAAAYLGTPRYMAPEQHLRRSATAESDQFSFCVAFWETLFGEHPFETDSEQSWTEVVTGNRRRRTPRGKAPGWLVEALDRGLAIEPAQRHASMAALIDLLERTPVRHRRFALAGGATAALALSGAAVFFVVRKDRVSCDRAGESVERVWNPAARDRVSRVLGEPGAPALAEIESTTERWRAARADSCKATHERGDQSPDLLDRRTRCFDRQLLELDALVTAIDAGTVPSWRALEAARALPDAGRCTAALAGTYAPPTGPRAEAAARLIADGDTAYRLGRDSDARTLGERAVAAARDIGDAGLLAEALELHGRATAEIDHVTARRLLEEALTLAARSGSPVIEANVAITLLGQATLEESTGRVSALLPVVAAAIGRAPPDRGLLATARKHEADALTTLGRFDEALRACDELAKYAAEPDAADQCRCLAKAEGKSTRDAIAACSTALTSAERAWGAKHPRVATALNNLAGLVSNAGEYDRGIDLAQKALAIDEAVLGGQSASTQRDLGTLAGNLAFAEKHKESNEIANRGLALLDKTPGQTDSMRAQLLTVRASNLLVLGDVAGGRRDAADALSFGLRAWGPEHPKAVLYHLRVAQSLGEYGTKDCDAAIKSFTHAAELAHRVYGPNNENRIIGLQGAAACMVQLGRAAEAKPLFVQMLEIAKNVQMQPYNVAMIHAAYSECLLAVKDREGARRELTKAREILVGIPEAAEMVKQVDAFMKTI